MKTLSFTPVSVFLCTLFLHVTRFCTEKNKKDDEEEDGPVVQGAQTAPQYGVSLNSPCQRQEIWNCPVSFDSHRRQRSVTEGKRKTIGEGRNPGPCTRHCVPHFNTINPPEKMVINVAQGEPFSLETNK